MLGTGLLQQSLRPKRLFASSHWLMLAPKDSMVISPLAAQHHIEVSCGRRVTAFVAIGSGVQQPANNRPAAKQQTRTETFIVLLSFQKKLRSELEQS
jgi:hypothetical protein